MPAIFELDLTVSEHEIDTLGHVNNVVYLEWMQRAAIEHSAAQGWGLARYREINAGWIARGHVIEYLQPAWQGDRLKIETWVSAVRKVVSWRGYRVLRVGDLETIAVAETKWAFVNLKSHRPSRVPEAFWADFTIVNDRADLRPRGVSPSVG